MKAPACFWAISLAGLGRAQTAPPDNSRRPGHSNSAATSKTLPAARARISRRRPGVTTWTACGSPMTANIGLVCACMWTTTTSFTPAISSASRISKSCATGRTPHGWMPSMSSSTAALYWDTSLYRGYVSLHNGSATLTAGRQRIGWGTARFWSPMDMFNPISPLQVESEERQGVDAALLAFSSPGALRWNVVYAPQDGFRRSTSALRLSRTIHNYDFDVVAARFGQDWTTGLDFAGQLRGAGLRGELTYRWRHPYPALSPSRPAMRCVWSSAATTPSPTACTWWANTFTTRDSRISRRTGPRSHGAAAILERDLHSASPFRLGRRELPVNAALETGDICGQRYGRAFRRGSAAAEP